MAAAGNECTATFFTTPPYANKTQNGKTSVIITVVQSWDLSTSKSETSTSCAAYTTRMWHVTTRWL